MLKENYDFDFATVDHEPFEEREMEDALTSDVMNLLLKMGAGFAFMGRQKEVIVGGRSRKIDLLFIMSAYVAIQRARSKLSYSNQSLWASSTITSVPLMHCRRLQTITLLSAS